MSDVVVVDEASAADQRDAGALIDEATRVDGQSAVSEQGRLLLREGAREGVRHLLLRRKGDLVGYAQVDGTDRDEAPAAELLVHPGERGRGYGGALVDAVLRETGGRVRVWAHGGHPAARHLAARLDLELFRELRQLRCPLAGLSLDAPPLPADVTLRTFVPGRDEEAWLALNAAAFADHAEQGALTRQDLDARMAEPWFDPAGFFLAVRAEDSGGAAPGERLVGFHWTKVHTAEGLGEVYVLGVRPGEQGTGLGKALTRAGLRYLAEDRGLATAMLYVDADNTAAVRLYEGMGFRTHETDLMYRTRD